MSEELSAEDQALMEAMMAYVPGAPLNGLRSDLERLLKLSWVE